MRQVVLVIALALSACTPAANRPRPVNVAAVRHEIEAALPADRKVVSMGRTTEAEATVYTADASGRHEEHWVREGTAWKLSGSIAIN